MQRPDLARWGILPMRLLVGYGFIEHGFAKLSRGPDAFAGILHQLGVPMPHLAASLTIGTELLGGLALLLGVFVVWASIPTALVLLVAMVTVHLPYGFSSVKLLRITVSGAQFGPVGYELDLLYLAALLVIALQGPGPLSIHDARQNRRTRVLEPLLRSSVNRESTASAADPTSLDQRYRSIREQMEGLFRELGLAA